MSEERPVVYPRWMTPALKARELARWEAVKAEPRPDGELGGLGYPDPPMFPWCDRFNALRGVCTLQSCSGHRAPDGHVWSGQLWLWLDAPTSLLLDTSVFLDLVTLPNVERVQRIYHDGGQEITDIVFRGGDELDESMRGILGAFARWAR